MNESQEIRVHIDPRLGRYLNSDGSVKTKFDDDTKSKYPCHNAKECKSTWTYDDWHCTGCHWKGLGREDLRFGDDPLRAKAAELKERLNATPELASQVVFASALGGNA